MPVAQEVDKWMDDCWLFMFGYLVRQFSERLLKVGYPEEEIWVTNFYNLTVNIMQQIEELKNNAKPWFLTKVYFLFLLYFFNLCNN